MRAIRQTPKPSGIHALESSLSDHGGRVRPSSWTPVPGVRHDGRRLAHKRDVRWIRPEEEKRTHSESFKSLPFLVSEKLWCGGGGPRKGSETVETLTGRGPAEGVKSGGSAKAASKKC